MRRGHLHAVHAVRHDAEQSGSTLVLRAIQSIQCSVHDILWKATLRMYDVMGVMGPSIFDFPASRYAP